MRADSGSSGLLPNKIDYLKKVAKQGRLDNGKNLLVAWISWEIRKLKCCVGHTWWTSSNRWRRNRWSRLWEFLGQQENPTVENRKKWQNKDACTMGKICCVPGFLRKIENSEVLCWTLLVDFVQPVEGNQVV